MGEKSRAVIRRGRTHNQGYIELSELLRLEAERLALRPADLPRREVLERFIEKGERNRKRKEGVSTYSSPVPAPHSIGASVSVSESDDTDHYDCRSGSCVHVPI